MKDHLWEDKWEDFSKKEIQEEIETDQQEEIRDQKIFNWIKSHDEELKNLISCDGPHSEGFPRDDVFTFELDTEIEGHQIYFLFNYAISRDGDEDGDGEFTIDGQEPHTHTAMNIEQWIADTCYEMV